MAARTILTVRDGQNVPLFYTLRNSALSTYFTTAQVTAVTGNVVDKAGNVLVSGLTLTYIANLQGYALDWNPGSLLDGLNWALVRLTPTRVSVPAALTPTREIELDLSDVLQRQDEIEAKIDTVDDFLDTEIAAIKAKTDQLTFTVANRVDAQVLGMATDTLTADALASSAVSEIQAGLSSGSSQVIEVVKVEQTIEVCTEEA